jgi:hypothetical protein
MRRAIIAAISSGLLLVALVSPAAAAQKVREQVPIGDFDITIEAGQGCSFPVLIQDLAGSIVYTSVERHGTLHERIPWRTTTRLTNGLDDTKWMEFTFMSVIDAEVQPDGSALVVGRNDVIVWYAAGAPSEFGEGVWLINHGQAVEEYDPDGNLVNASLLSGEVTDVCAALS